MSEPLTREDLSSAQTTLGRFEAEVRLKGWEIAVAAGRWDRAFGRIRGLADVFGPETPSNHWAKLLGMGLEAAARSNARGEVGRFVRRVAGNTEALGFEPLREVFEECAQRKNDALAEEIGAALAQAWPRAAIGWFARADAAERRATARGWRPQLEWSTDFGMALERLDPTDPIHDHVAVRRITAHLRAYGDRADIRSALADLKIYELDDADARWLAFGLAHSPHWLDQVKACDLIDRQLEASADAEVVEVVRSLFDHLSPAPHEVVLERFSTLIQHPSLASERPGWTAALELRARATDVAAEPLVETSLGGAPGVLAAALRGKREDADGFLALVRDLILNPNDDQVEAVRRALVTVPPTGWRVVGVAWPSLFESEVSTSLLDRLGKAWCAQAPQPSYGWWQLALHFETAGAKRAALAAGRRGLSESPHQDVETRDVVLGKLLHRLVRDANATELLEWLEACEAVAQSSG